MDAASRTGVEAMRELLDGVRYRPASARYKVYILDEVHMFTPQAFNALLKTLEEPPPHVKFVFATTDIRRVPITILSRCQRFDLRRVDAALLVRHLEAICAKEGISAEPEALARELDVLLSQPERRAELGAAARATVAEHFTWAACGRATVAAYEQAQATRPIA